MTHDYDLISSFQVRLTVTLGERTSKLEPQLITVSDDDDDVPRLVWTLPSPVVRPGQRAVVGWSITDPSGLAFVSVVIQGPQGPLARFDTPQGEYVVAAGDSATSASRCRRAISTTTGPPTRSASW